MQFKKYSKQRNRSIQGLRSFKDTLPKNIKKVINKKGYIYSETLSNWKYIVGENLFKVCYPKSFKHSNRFGQSSLLIVSEYTCPFLLMTFLTFFGKVSLKDLKP